MKEYNLIFEEESCYGFLPDIIEMLENEYSKDNNNEMLEEALEESKRILEETDDTSNIYLVECDLMGGYSFYKLSVDRTQRL